MQCRFRHSSHPSPFLQNNFIAIITSFIIFSNIALILMFNKLILFNNWKERDEMFSNHLCDKNPFVSSLQSSLPEISSKVDDWMIHQNEKLVEILNVSKNDTAYFHRSFKAFEKVAECLPQNVTCIGGPCNKDGSKFMCGSINALNEIKNCIVYSFGSNDEWSFEMAIMQHTQCEV